MGYMKSVDIVLTAHKLSEPQKNAVVELLSGGFTTAKLNTIKSLENKDLIKFDNGWDFTEPFKTELKAAYSTPEAREVKNVAASQGIVLTDEEALQVSQEDVEDVTAMVQSSTEFDKFDDKWDAQFKVTAGFGATLDWRGTEVWTGLTAAEIKEDMKTATPLNRRARRTHFRTLRNAYRRLTVERPRKALKVTGKVGV